MMNFEELLTLFDKVYVTDPLDMLLLIYIEHRNWTWARKLIEQQYLQHYSVWSKGYALIENIFKEQDMLLSKNLVKLFISIQYYVQVNIKFPLLKFLFYFAVRKGSRLLVNKILDLGVGVNSILEAEYPLNLAILYQSSLDIISLLINRGARVNDNRQPALLYVMVPSTDFEVAELLLHSGADVNITLTDPLFKSSNTLINIACKFGNHEGLKWLLNHNASTEGLKNAKGGNGLFLAVEADSLPCVQILIDKGVSLDLKNNEKKTALVVAVENNMVDIAEFLIQHGAKWCDKELNKAIRINVISGSSRDLQNPNHEMLEMLLQYGFAFNINIIDKKFLLAAVQNRYFWIVKKYVDAGKKLYSVINGTSLLITAVRSKNKDLVEIFCNNKFESDNCLVESALTMSVIMNLTEITELLLSNFLFDKHLWLKSCIHIAADHLNIDMIKVLLKFGAEVNSRDVRGSMPLHYAILANYFHDDSRKSSREVDLVKSRVVNFLLKKGADADAEMELVSNEINNRPIHLAIRRNYAEVLKVLLEGGASLDTDVKVEITLGSSTVLHYAIKCKSSATIVKTLVQNGAAVDTLQFDGRTPLLMAIEANNFEVVKVLLENGANVCNKSPYHHNLVEYAVGLSSSLIVSELIKFGANIDDKNRYGFTALEKACRTSKVHMVRVLLNHGADINLLTTDIFAPFTDKYTALPAMRFFAQGNWPEYDYHEKIEPSMTIFYLQREAFNMAYLGLPLSPCLKPFLDVEYSKDFYDSCSKELEVLKTTKIQGTCLCLYDIIKQNHDPAYRYNNNVLCYLTCNSDLLLSIPLFSGILKRCIRQAELRNKLLDAVQEWFSNQVRISCLPVLPNEVIRKVISYLDNKTLSCYTAS